MALSWFLHGSFQSKTSGFSVFNPDILQIFCPKKSHLFQPFFDPTLRPLGVSQTLKGCSKSKLAIAFLNWSLMSQEGDDLEEPKNPKNPTNPTNPTNVMCTIFFSRFSPSYFKDKKNETKNKAIESKWLHVASNQILRRQVIASFHIHFPGVEICQPRRNHWRNHSRSTPFCPTVSHHSTLLSQACNKRWYRSRIPRVEDVFQVKVLVSGVCWW